MNIETGLRNSAIKAIEQLYGQTVTEQTVQFQKTRAGFEGHLTLVVFPFLKISRKRPDETAREIGEWMKANDDAVADYNAVGGFLNLILDPAVWTGLLNSIHTDPHYGERQADSQSPLVMIEYSSPTPTSPFTWAMCATTCWAGRWHRLWPPTVTRW